MLGCQFGLLASRLAAANATDRRVRGRSYSAWADVALAWLDSTGLIDPTVGGLARDGLWPRSVCNATGTWPRGQSQAPSYIASGAMLWTYNQGLLAYWLAVMGRAERAAAMIDASLRFFAPAGRHASILTEACDAPRQQGGGADPPYTGVDDGSSCSCNQESFKGVLMRYFMRIARDFPAVLRQTHRGGATLTAFFSRQSDAVFALGQCRTGGLYGSSWRGPCFPVEGYPIDSQCGMAATVSPGRQISAVDAFVAAAATE